MWHYYSITIIINLEKAKVLHTHLHIDSHRVRLTFIQTHFIRVCLIKNDFIIQSEKLIKF